MSSGRLGAIAAVLIGAAGVVSGVRALRAAGRPNNGRVNARRRLGLALVAGPVAVALGGLVAATARGGVGTGGGLAGAVVGMTVGLFASVLGLLAVARSRRT